MQSLALWIMLNICDLLFVMWQFIFPQCAHWAYLWFIVFMKSLFDIVNKDKENEYI